MSYQVLARKWRPKTFREMVGQEHVLKALINALDHNRLHHAYLFTGTRGVGKTTIARILAKCLNCESGVSSEPCGQCSACVSINEGRFVDLIEVDAASRTKVEDTRELLENVQYAPSAGRFKVYLIDEVHMLSNHSFNALLKTLEEPPPHVKFLLATTDPQKLPATILSRCLQFNLKNMTPERIVGHLQHVLGQEMIAFEEPSLWLLGRAADGSMRDALSLTDQAVSFGSGKLVEADVRNMLGTIDQSSIDTLINALIAADGAEVLRAVSVLAEHAPDYGAALEALLSQLHRIAIAQAVPGAMDNSFGDQQLIEEWAASLAAEDVQLFYQLALTGRRDLSLAPDPRSGFEMVLLRMLAFKPAGIAELPQSAVVNTAPVQSATAAEVPAPVKKPESPSQPSPVAAEPAPVAVETASASRPARSSGSDQSVVASVIAPTAKAAAEVSEPQKALPEQVSTPEEPARQASTSQPGTQPVSDPEPSTVVDPAPALTLSQLTPETWVSRFEQLGFGGVVGNIASHCILQRIEGDSVYLLLDQSNATLFSDSYTDRIQAHLSVALNAPLTVKIEVAELNSETPSARKERLIKERKQQAVISLQNDPNVQLLINEFDATLSLETVEPL